jgi:MurNAc alpha-1-phosphate uridylyltransferase
MTERDTDLLKNTGLSDTAMLLAAGRGERLRPLTLMKPKPLFEVGGRAMLDHALDRLVESGVRRVVVNCFYLADQIVDHLAKRRDVEIVISREDELLDTGGGIRHVLSAFGGKPFFALNADLMWLDGEEPALARLARLWDPARMDALLLMMKTEKARGFGPQGDFNLDGTLEEGGRLRRHPSSPPRSHVWIGAQILKPALFAAEAERVFSNNKIWDKAEEAGRLFGLEHTGTCFHVGTPEDWAMANRLLETGEGW